jgi:hypothetical protein
VAAVETIKRMDEEIELKDNKISILQKELNLLFIIMVNIFNSLLNKKSVIGTNNKERAKKRLLDTLSLSYKK